MIGDMNTNEYLESVHRGMCENGGCGGPVAFALILMLFLLCGCTTQKEAVTENHSYSLLVDKMDSIARTTETWQKDFLSRQTTLIEKFQQKEKSDSSYSAVVNEKGDTVKERIVIYKEIVTDHSTEKEEKEMWMQMFHQQDSLLRVCLEKQEETDSLLRKEETVVEVPAELSWWQELRLWLGNISLIGILVLLGYGGWRLFRVIKGF